MPRLPPWWTTTPCGEAARDDRPVRVLRVITRMNVGGPAIHVSILSGRLDARQYETLLVHGTVGPGEASLGHLAAENGARAALLPALRTRVDPKSDLRALLALIRTAREFRPDIVHTHTAKAGVVGRLAALLARAPRPIIVHTYHGHVLEGYFGPRVTAAYRLLERMLARITSCLVGVSDPTIDDLVRLGIAPRDRFRKIPLGLDLDRFLALTPAAGDAFRRELGAGENEVILAFVGRLAPIKRVDLLLDALATARRDQPLLRLAIAGDGTLRSALESQANRLGLTEFVHFLGYRADTPAIVAGSDIAVLSSDNEGTPVALIEAAAAARPAVATNVGGVPEVVTSHTGVLVGADDSRAFAKALVRLAADPGLRARLGARARDRSRERYQSSRLLTDVDNLYRELLAARAADRCETARGFHESPQARAR